MTPGETQIEDGAQDGGLSEEVRERNARDALTALLLGERGLGRVVPQWHSATSAGTLRPQFPQAQREGGLALDMDRSLVTPAAAQAPLLDRVTKKIARPKNEADPRRYPCGQWVGLSHHPIR